MLPNNQQKVGILLVNVGTPRAPNIEAIRDYLKEFLSDPFVVNLPRWLWLCILNLIILKKRPPALVPLYQKIWTQEGSPLLAISFKQLEALSASLEMGNVLLKLGMRYGEPSIKEALLDLKRKEIKKIILLPLFPHFSQATIGSIQKYVFDCSEALDFNKEDVITIEPFFAKKLYIHALKNSINDFWGNNQKGEILLFSYHGLPIKNTDSTNYLEECRKTTELTAQALNLQSNNYLLCFQSRFGFGEWLKPYTDKILIELAQKGIKKIDIICPGFVADCLETLEEIKVRYAEIFCNAGGETLHYIPCLNDRPDFIHLLKTEILMKLKE